MSMTRTGVFVGTTVCLAIAAAALAQTPAPSTQGSAVVGTVQVTATVAKIDQATRQVTLKTDDGREVTFVADPAVKNLPQVKAGDQVVATYTEALAYEVKKGGSAGVSATMAGGTAKPGAMPAGAIAKQVTITVTIAAIDPKVPSVTFKGPQGNTRTIKVQRPERLQGVSVGDTVDLTYTEALAIKIDPAPKK
jgi:hypothetical protein